MTDTEWEKLQTGVDTRRLLAGAAQRCEVIGFRPAAFARASVRRSSSRFSSVRPPPLLRIASSSACVAPSALFRATARLVRSVKRIFFIVNHLGSDREAVPTALDGPFLVCLPGQRNQARNQGWEPDTFTGSLPRPAAHAFCSASSACSAASAAGAALTWVYLPAVTGSARDDG